MKRLFTLNKTIARGYLTISLSSAIVLKNFVILLVGLVTFLSIFVEKSHFHPYTQSF